MNKVNFSFVFITLVFLITACKKEQQRKPINNTSKEVSYFGQTPPTDTPEIFAPNSISVSGRYEYAVSFSPNMDELFFSGNKEGAPQFVYHSSYKNNSWTVPKKANLTKGKKKNELEAFVDPKGEKIFFTAYDSIFSDENIWYVNRKEGSWSEAMLMESPINDDLVFYSNAANNGDLFYTSISKWKMFYAPNKNGTYPEVHEVGIEFGGHGFISPNQDFILVDAPKDNDDTKDRDIFVCFKKENGTWTKPINLGDSVNSSFTETCPSLSPDGKYLFFSRYDEEGGFSNIYWVSAAVIQQVKPKEFDYSNFSLQAGDILFQDSDCGPFCESIEKVTFGVDGSKFSHVGLVIPNENNELVVIEAVTAGVVLTPLDQFFNRSFDENNNSKVVVGRLKKEHKQLIPKAIEFSKTKIGLEYDEAFNIFNNKYYCSELLYDSFKYANNNQPIFQLQKMTYNDPDTNRIFPIWETYFQDLNIPVPEGEPGLNPGGMSTSEYIDIVHFYGKPQGYTGQAFD